MHAWTTRLYLHLSRSNTNPKAGETWIEFMAFLTFRKKPVGERIGFKSVINQRSLWHCVVFKLITASVNYLKGGLQESTVVFFSLIIAIFPLLCELENYHCYFFRGFFFIIAVPLDGWQIQLLTQLMSRSVMLPFSFVDTWGKETSWFMNT